MSQACHRRGPSRLPLAVLALTALWLAGPAHAWRDTAHMVVTQLAIDAVRPSTRAEIDRLLTARGVSPAILSGNWMDRIKEQGFRGYDSLHYVNLPLRLGQPEPAADPPADIAEQALSGEIVSAIDEARVTLADTSRDDRQRGRALLFLIHLVADLHQPMHCATLVSSVWPDGDRGGNDFTIDHADGNLHQLWDQTAGLLPVLDATRAADLETLPALAAFIDRQRPEGADLDVGPDATWRWAWESYRLAYWTVYAGMSPGDRPSASYLDRARRTIGPRLALAGARLAALLDLLLASSSAD